MARISTKVTIELTAEEVRAALVEYACNLARVDRTIPIDAEAPAHTIDIIGIGYPGPLVSLDDTDGARIHFGKD